jgi:predicted naringenin-chalcone synthase
MITGILGLGTALPTRRVAQEQAAVTARAACCDDMKQERFLDGVYRRSGIATRGSVLLADGDGGGVTQTFYPPRLSPEDPGPGTAERMQRYVMEAPPLALAAAEEALSEAGIPANSITHLITISCTGFGAPGIDVALIRGLGLRPTVRRAHIGFMGCHAAINGLELARALCADPAARVLLCAVELCSLHLQYGFDPGQVVANALFADGAAAAVLAGRPEDAPGLSLRATGSCLFPESEDAMSWHIGDHGFVMTLSQRVPDLIVAQLRPWLGEWLSTQGESVASIGSWAVHPGGPRILTSVQEALSLDPAACEASRAVLEACGNMSSPTILFILQRLIREGAAQPLLALGFGPGLMAEAALISRKK